MSAIKPFLKTRMMGNFPIIETDYEVDAERPAAGYGDSPIASAGMLNYLLHHHYGAPETFAEQVSLMNEAVSKGLCFRFIGPDGRTNAFNRATSEANKTGNQGSSITVYHFIDEAFNNGDNPSGYGIYMMYEGTPGQNSQFDFALGYRTARDWFGFASHHPATMFDSEDTTSYYGYILVFKWKYPSGGYEERRSYHFGIIALDTIHGASGGGLQDFYNGYFDFVSVDANFGEDHFLDNQDHDPNDENGTTDPTGNQQEVDNEVLTDTDDIEMPIITMYPSTAAAGLVTLYAPSQALMESFSDEIWQDNAIETISQYFGKPSDAIVGMGVLPFSPPTSGYKRPKIGLYTCTTALPVVSHQFHEIDCGSLLIKPAWDNYLDYSPYTRILIYLPYVGTRELDVDEIMGHRLFVKYRVDCYNGNLVAFVGIDGLNAPAVRYQFSGNCMQQLPINAQSFDAMLSAGIQMATALVGGIAVGGAAAAAEDAALSAAAETGSAAANRIGVQADLSSARRTSQLANTCVANIMGMKPKVEKTGAIGASIGQMSVQRPFITRIMPRQSLPERYMRYKGYPLNATSKIGDNPGFTVVDAVRLNDLPATEHEIAEIYALLKEGVIV